MDSDDGPDLEEDLRRREREADDRDETAVLAAEEYAERQIEAAREDGRQLRLGRW